MKAEYKRDLQNNYLILEVPEDREEDGYQLFMAEKNEIQGLLPFYSSRKDGVRSVYYEITSRQTLESVYEKKSMKYQDMIRLMSDISDTLECIQKYLLSPSRLLFDPKFIYLEPDRGKIQLCYFPAAENDCPVLLLGEFLLKRLDHEERQAVMLGYSFYQNAMEKNFSLSRTLKELLEKTREENSQNNFDTVSGGTEKKSGIVTEWKGRKSGIVTEGAGRKSGIVTEGVGRKFRAVYEEPEIKFSTVYEETEKKVGKAMEGKEGSLDFPEGGIGVKLRSVRESENFYENRKNTKKLWIRFCEMVNPLILIGWLFGVIGAEVVLYLQLVTLTEAGGLFFLDTGAAVLINRFWKKKKKENQGAKNRTEGEMDIDENPEQELYETLYEEDTEEKMEQTVCILPSSGKTRLRLASSGSFRGMYPDIFVGDETVIVGKAKGDADLIINAPTISRRHAKLERLDGKYYIQDLNSKNGTFCNGNRLNPQQQCEFAVGDQIGFAEIVYQAVAEY